VVAICSTAPSGDGDLECLAHAGAVVAADQEPQRGDPGGRRIVAGQRQLPLVAFAEEVGQRLSRGAGMIAVACLDHRELGHVAGDAATEEQRLAVRGDRHPPRLEHLVGEVAGDPQRPVVGKRGAAVGGDHHAVLAHHRHRQRHARRSLSREVPSTPARTG
jgi:hypothetical protein